MDQLSGVKGQRVLVTAGAAGIGFAIARTLAGMGARVAICDISEEALAKARADLPEVAACVADVSVDADVDRMFDTAVAGLGGLDALINNAGIAGPTGGVDEISPADWRRCIDICLTGQFLCAVLVFGEPLSGARLVSFALVWTGVAVFVWPKRTRTKAVG